MFSADTGAITREANSDEGSDSGTDEEEFPSQVKASRFSTVKAVEDEQKIPELLAKQGVVVLSTPILKEKVAITAGAACQQLRDDAELSFMFASPSASAAPGSCEAVHIDDSVLKLLKACDKRAYTSVVKALEACTTAATKALAALGHPRVARAGVPMASVGEADLTERWHSGVDGCPTGTPILLTTVLALNGDGVEALRVLPSPATTPAAAAARGKRPRAGSAKSVMMSGLSVQPECGQLTLVAPDAYRSAVVAGGSSTITMWWRAAGDDQGNGGTRSNLSNGDSASSVGSAAGGAKCDDRIAPCIFDGLLSETTRAALASTRPIRWAIYDRQVASPRNAQERAIESMLTALGDTSRFVEYWGRARWSSVPAHYDCDEGRLVNARTLRQPTHAHVLYLDVPDDVRAPTVLWRPAPGADGAPLAEIASGGHRRAVEVFVSPAVGGRLLRFCGSWVHGVPRPAREYLGEADEEEEVVVEEEAADGGEADCEEGEEEEEEEEEEEQQEEQEEAGEEEKEGEEEAGEEEEEEEEGGEVAEAEPEEPEVRRLVLLFNCWPDLPPRSDDKTDDADAAKTGEPVAYDDDVAVACEPWTTWQRREFAAEDKGDEAGEEASTALVARLMGTPRRRGSAMRFRADDVVASRQALRAALRAADVPQRFSIR